MEDQIVDLAPDDPRAKEAIIGLIGSTFAQLREIDRNVVGSSNNIKALKTDVKELVTQVINYNGSGPVQLAPAPAVLTNTVVAAGINTQQPVHIAVSAPQEDENQLVFDFTKKITPDTINDKLDKITDKLNRLLELAKS